MSVRLAVLGPMRAWVGEQEVDLGGPRQRAVIARLAVAKGDFVPSDRLIDDIWPDQPPADPAASLQTFVSRLRRRLQPDASARERAGLLVSGATGYALRLPADAVDAWRFEQLVAAGTAAVDRAPHEAEGFLQEALALWEGPALADYAEQAWAQPEVTRLDELRAVARERLLAARLATGDPAVLIADLERLVADAPLREERWRLLVLALYRAHRQADALGALRRARTVLVEELGVDPGPALRAVEEQVLAQEPSLSGPAPVETAQPAQSAEPAAVPVAAGRAEDPLVERAVELAILDGVIDQVGDGAGTVVVVDGPPGIGKSRLLAETRRRAAARGVTVLVARASQLEQDFPFGIARQLFEPVVLGAAAAGPDGEPPLRGAAAAAKPVFDLDAPVGGPDSSSFATLHGLYWVTRNLAAEAPVVLVVDDVHWADAGSVRFLGYLARRLEDAAIAVVLAYRTGEQHALGALLDELRQDPATVTVRPVPLTRAAVADMIRTGLGAEPDAEFVDACLAGTAGNPLLVRQMLRGLAADRVVPDRSHADVARALSSRAVSSMVLLRLRRLPAAARAVARALAVLGDGAALPHVAELAGTSDADAAQLITALVGAEIVRPEPPLGFVHPLVREGIYADVPPAERELLHESAARVLDRAGRSDEQVAAQLLKAPHRGEPWAVDVLRRAAREAVHRGSPDSAVTFLTRALAEPPPRDQRGDVLLQLGRVEASTDGVAAVRDLRAAHDTLTDPVSRAAAAIDLTRTLAFAGELGSPVAFAEQALAALPAELTEQRAAIQAYQRISGHMHGVDATLWHFADEPPVPGDGYGSRMLQAALAFERMCRAAPRDETARIASAALRDDVIFDHDPGLLWVAAHTVLDFADADVLPMWDHMRAAAEQRGSMFAVLSVGIWGGWSMLRRGRLAEGERSIRTAIEQLDVWQRGTATLAYAEAMVGRVLLERGETEQALAVVERALTGPTGTEGGRLLVEVKADILLDDGRVADALELLEASVRRTPHLVNPVWRADRQAWCVAAAGVGRHGEALASAQDLVAIAGRWGAPSTVGEALLTLGRVQELVPGQDGVETLTSAATVLAGTDRPVLHAHALTALGAALAGRGDPGADAVLDRAEGIAAACEALRVVRAVGEIRQRDAGVAAAVSR